MTAENSEKRHPQEPHKPQSRLLQDIKTQVSFLPMRVEVPPIEKISLPELRLRFFEEPVQETTEPRPSSGLVLHPGYNYHHNNPKLIDADGKPTPVARVLEYAGVSKEWLDQFPTSNFRNRKVPQREDESDKEYYVRIAKLIEEQRESIWKVVDNTAVLNCMVDMMVAEATGVPLAQAVMFRVATNNIDQDSTSLQQAVDATLFNPAYVLGPNAQLLLQFGHFLDNQTEGDWRRLRNVVTFDDIADPNQPYMVPFDEVYRREEQSVFETDKLIEYAFNQAAQYSMVRTRREPAHLAYATDEVHRYASRLFSRGAIELKHLDTLLDITIPFGVQRFQFLPKVFQTTQPIDKTFLKNKLLPQ